MKTSPEIAIVDDEESLCSIYSLMLRKLGYSVDFVAHNGKQIVDAIMNNAILPSLIVMDYRMPVMNGIEAAELIKKSHAEIKILIASADDSIIESVETMGMHFLPKPFGFRVFSDAINQSLQSNTVVSNASKIDPIG
jgi:DNA-binding NtrC family response regulator